MEGTSTLSVAKKAAELTSPQAFSEWIDERMQAQQNIVGAVKEQVLEQLIEPLEAARIVSCVAGSIFGYEEFHPRAGTPPAEQLLEVLAESTRSLSR